jgi:hypothetical protein
MNTMPTYKYGRGEELQTRMGIDMLLSEKIAAIIVFSANIENHLERAIWQLRGGVEKGVRPDTDAKQITELIDMMSKIAAAMAPGDRQTMLQAWCAAARSGFVIRNNIVHGQTIRMETTVAFMRNTLWDGIERKRPFGDLWADHNTLDMVRDSFAVLLRIVWTIAKGDDDPTANASAMRALREAKSILGEFASQGYNPSFEKY